MTIEYMFVIGHWCVDGVLRLLQLIAQFKSKSQDKIHLMDKSEVLCRATEDGADQDYLGLGVQQDVSGMWCQCNQL